MKLFITLILILVFAASPIAVVDVSHSVGRLESASGDEGGICTAVVIAEGLALTAAHCVDTEHKLSVTFQNRDAELIRTNKILDLAVIKFQPDGEVPVALAESSPNAGDSIMVAGYPFGIEQMALQFGHVALKVERTTKLMWLDVELIPGDSGGPVFTLDGKLIGINVAIFSSGPAKMSAAVPFETVRDFIKPLLKK